MTLRVRLEDPDREVEARLEEVAPSTDPKSHTVLVKAGLPAEAGARPGAFGRLIQTCDRRSALLVPSAAVSRSGQLELVRVLEDGRPRVRNVRTGKRHGDDVEVLSVCARGSVVLRTRP
jgi:multidrug efflux pump subunit AcrA (membrane-fusion protein)